MDCVDPYQFKLPVKLLKISWGGGGGGGSTKMTVFDSFSGVFLNLCMLKSSNFCREIFFKRVKTIEMADELKIVKLRHFFFGRREGGSAFKTRETIYGGGLTGTICLLTSDEDVLNLRLSPMCGVR